MASEKPAPTIEERENGPLVVKGVDRIVGSDGTQIDAAPVMALCRCGASANKPFCDGTHSKIGFESRGGEPSGKDTVITYEGTSATVSYNPRVCSHAAECGRLASNIFNPKQKPWIQPDNGTLDQIEAVVHACPSGALTITRDGAPTHLYPERPQISVEKNGSYWILGVDAPVGPQAEGMDSGKYVLCRCGKSGNKPYCDGTHYNEGWKE